MQDANNQHKTPSPNSSPSPDEEIYGQDVTLPDEEATYRPPSPHKNRKSPPFLLIGLIVAAIIIGAGVAAFLTMRNGDGEEASTPAVEAPETDTEPTIADDEGDATTDFSLEEARSTTPRMEFSYPDTWDLYQQDNAVWFESPALSFTTAAGEQIENGFFRLYIRQGARDIDSQYIARGIASRSSEPLTYDNPATDQREDTLLQFFGQDSGGNTAFIMVSGNFELSPGDTLGPDFGADGESYIIVGGYTSGALEDDLATHPVSSEYFTSTNAYDQAIDIIKSLRLL